MTLGRHDAELYVPDGVTPELAMERADILAIGAHPDDLEIMAASGILKAGAGEGRRFFGIVATNGGGTRCCQDRDASDYRETCGRRIREQKRAADLGRYSGLALLNWESQEIKDACFTQPDDDLRTLILQIQPREVYLHNPLDRHDTHVAVCLRSIAALRTIARDTGRYPEAVYGCENRRGLDWLIHCDRASLPVSDPEALTDRLLEAFSSQVATNRHYVKAVRGRRIANATFQDAPGAGDGGAEVTFALDLLPLVEDPGASVCDFAEQIVERVRADVRSRIERFSPGGSCRGRR